MKWLFTKRLVVSIVISASTLGIAAQPAAADKPIRECPDDFTLAKVGKDPVNISVDLNGDGKICEKPSPAAPHDEDNFIVIDNTSNSGD